MGKQRRTQRHVGHDATDAGTPSPSSCRSGNTSRTHQGSAGKRKASDSSNDVHPVKRHRRAAASGGQTESSTITKDESDGDEGEQHMLFERWHNSLNPV